MPTLAPVPDNNTATTYTSSDKGPPIGWLNGAKAADNYEDFYDGSWDNENATNELGNAQRAGCFGGTRQTLWTGSKDDGTGNFAHEFGGFSSSTATGAPACVSGNPLAFGVTTSGDSKRFYALSPVIKLLDEVTVQSVSIPSTPANATSGYDEGETIQVRIDFSESVSVTGTPYLVLDIAGAARRATYASGSGTRYLNFEYTVQTGDFDSNGISLCSSRLIDPGCGRISLGGGRISAQSDGLAAELDLPALGNQSDHKVDGMPTFIPNPGVGPMPGPGTGQVALNWALTPPGLVRPGSFRLLFATSRRDATSAAIADYNNHAISDAGAGHSAIRAFKNGFRVIASTEAVDARDNAGLTGTGVPIYWMGSNDKVADDYADVLDGSWDSGRPTDKNGSASSQRTIWTGSKSNGTEGLFFGDSAALGTAQPASATLNGSSNQQNPLGTGRALQDGSFSLYALSQELKLPPLATRRHNPDGGLRPTSRPPRGDTYRLGETFIFPFEFTEPVVVRGVPTMPLELDSGTVRARYVSGSGTKRLLFAYTVQTDDYDTNAPRLLFRAGDSYMALDGASVRALADGSPALLVADDAWSYPFNAFGSYKMEGRPPQATTASISSSPESGTTYGTGETITVTLTMREDVRVPTASRLPPMR